MFHTHKIFDFFSGIQTVDLLRMTPNLSKMSAKEEKINCFMVVKGDNIVFTLTLSE